MSSSASYHLIYKHLYTGCAETPCIAVNKHEQMTVIGNIVHKWRAKDDLCTSYTHQLFARIFMKNGWITGSKKLVPHKHTPYNYDDLIYV
jgi:hypothetical protein